MSTVILPAYTLAVRESRLFFRQKNRVIGALMQPLIFWFFIGAGMNASFLSINHPNMPYADYFFPGIIMMVIMFTAIFATIGVIEDRQQGFLRGVIIAPVSRSAIVIGKVIGGSFLATFQGMLFLLLTFTPMIHIKLTLMMVIWVIIVMSVVAAGLTGLGLAIAWRTDSIQGYHAIMSVVLFPMWILSGAIFPLDGTPGWLYWIITINPLTHGLEIMRYLLFHETFPYRFAFGSVSLSIIYVLITVAGTFLLSIWTVRRRD